MKLPYLSDDCIYYILKYLRDDHSTLFNCLLVNRFWCKETVPFLYANPFEHLIGSKNNTTHKCSIIFTLISCFDKAEILKLKNQLNEYNDNINYYINEENESLFEYPKYLENYNCLTINNIIFEWFKNFFNIPSNNEIVANFIPTFHQSNLRQSINIKRLDISFYSFFFNKNNNIRSFDQNLTKLNSLSLRDINEKCNDFTQEFLESVANICSNLKRLEISSLPNNISMKIKENLCKIIQNQNKFNALKISRCESFLNNIFLSLEFQKHSLVYIEFVGINFGNIPFKNFITLYNLKYLSFIYCGEISSEQCNLLNFATFKLKELTLLTWSNNIALSMIKYLGKSLQKLYFDGISITITIIEYISTYCLNLNSLKLRIGSGINYVFPYFKNLRINNLILIIHNQYFRNNLLANLFENLAPINVKEISIYLFYFSDTTLKEILENCHHRLEMINLNINIDLEKLQIILNYIEKNNNSLKFLGTKKLERVLKDEETKLLDQIKARGVTLLDFYSVYHECSPLIYNSF
ncbi:unnamed protein product [Rhizophagus irregularis]|nr:unnamed protein product [Rhizophagus irregularis]CAB5308831.1 unnamed protein product [Rhizophagus irregularis]